MPARLDKIDIGLPVTLSFTLYDDGTVRAEMDYTVLTSQGETISRSMNGELSGLAKTRATNAVNDGIARAKTQEGIP